MRALLDTHTLAWWLLNDRRLSQSALRIVADPANEIWVSAVSAFETATKYRIRKWNDIRDLAIGFEAAVVAEGFEMLSILAKHASRGGILQGTHRDPFDRLLAAQSLIEDMPIVTNDPAFRAFGVETLW